MIENSTPGTITLAPGRECGDCAMCCKLLDIQALNKPANEWCMHCSSRKGCDAYETRPQPCRTFFCGWMREPGIGEEWKPSHSRMMINYSLNGEHLFIIVDPSRPDAWRKEPYYRQLKKWAEINNANGQQIIVRVDKRFIVIFPDREQDLGTVEKDETVTFTVTQTPMGPVTEAHKRKINEQ